MRIYPTLHSRRRADGTHLVQVCVYDPASRKRAFDSMGWGVERRHWNENGEAGKRNWVRGTHPEHRRYNADLAARVRELEDVRDAHPNYSPEQLLNPPALPASLTDVYAYWRRYIEASSHNWSYHTIAKHEVSLRLFEAYAPRLEWSQINRTWLGGFVGKRLRDGRGPNTIKTNLTKLHSVCRAAMVEGVIQSDPFLGFSMPSATPDRLKMSAAQVEVLEAAERLTMEMARSRDIFLFQLYAGGMRIGEVLPIRWEDVDMDAGVFYFYKGKRRKGQRVRMQKKLNDRLRVILGRYIHRRDEGLMWVFPVLSDRATEARPEDVKNKTTLVNNGLYALADRLGLPRFSTHIARHTFTDMARKKGVNLYGLSKALGHATLAITESYLKSFDQEAADDAVDAVWG